MTGAVILAAGSSSRLGRPKQFVELDGEPLVHRAARIALEAGCAPVVIVEGAVALAPALAGLSVEIVRCDDWAAGQGASLKRGVDALKDRVSSLVVLLVDQHRVTSDDLRALIAASGSIAAASYAGTLGVPVRFSGPDIGVLSQLPPERGARAWLAAHRERVTPVPMPHAEIDLDRPADLPLPATPGRGSG